MWCSSAGERAEKINSCHYVECVGWWHDHPPPVTFDYHDYLFSMLKYALVQPAKRMCSKPPSRVLAPSSPTLRRFTFFYLTNRSGSKNKTISTRVPVSLSTRSVEHDFVRSHENLAQPNDSELRSSL
jgi:hypothetical protein